MYECDICLWYDKEDMHVIYVTTYRWFDSWYDKDDTRMNVIYVCPLYAYFLLCLCLICENRIQIEIQIRIQKSIF